MSGVVSNRELRHFIHSREPRWRKLLQELVRIPSTFESEHAMVDRVVAYVEGLGVTVRRVPHHSHRLKDDVAAQPPFQRRPGPP